MSLLWFMFLVTSLFRAWAWIENPVGLPIRRIAAEVPMYPLTASVDLDSVVRRGTLRIITREATTTYFRYRGRRLGFEYELAEAFARRLNVHLEIVVPPTWDDVVPWLMAGKGDIAAPGFLVSPGLARGAVAARAYDTASPAIVTRSGRGTIQDVDDLAGRTAHVRQNSAAHRALVHLNERLGGKIDIVASACDPEVLLADVARGKIDVAVVPRRLARIEQAYRPDLSVGATIGAPDSVAWLVRPNSPHLRDAVDRFFAESLATPFYRDLHEKYFDHAGRYIVYRLSRDGARSGWKFTSYDPAIRRAAGKFGLDWLLLAAQMYQESKFDPLAESWMGATGLMQLMPGTASILGIHDPWNPYQNIEGGARYLARLIARFDTLDVEDAIAFGLASYNAGLGHVLDARAVAREEGLDPDRWAGNVEVTMPLLADERYYSRARFGYVRGSETTRYVSEILQRWRTFQERAGKERPHLASTPT